MRTTDDCFIASQQTIKYSEFLPEEIESDESGDEEKQSDEEEIQSDSSSEESDHKVIKTKRGRQFKVPRFNGVAQTLQLKDSEGSVKEFKRKRSNYI